MARAWLSSKGTRSSSVRFEALAGSSGRVHVQDEWIEVSSRVREGVLCGRGDVQIEASSGGDEGNLEFGMRANL